MGQNPQRALPELTKPVENLLFNRLLCSNEPLFCFPCKWPGDGRVGVQGSIFFAPTLADGKTGYEPPRSGS